MRTLVRVVAGPLALAACAACGDFLSVGNSNDPDRRDLLADPAQLETRTAEAFRSLYAATVGSTFGLGAQSKVMAGENDAWCPTVLSTRGAIPRMPIDNSRGNRHAGENQADFAGQSRAAREAADALHAMETWRVSSGSAARDARLRAFAWFTVGVAQGNLALFYDSSGVVDPYAELTAFPQLLGYREAMAVALAYLDSAVAWTAIAAAASGPDGFPLPSTWINGNPLTAAQFTQLIRSYKAQFRADVARTRAEGAAVDWSAVLDDATNGLPSDLPVAAGAAWRVAFEMGCFGWSTAYQFYIGMADTSGGYDVWLPTPTWRKEGFLVVTPDRRFPQGTTREAQQTNSPALPSGVQALRNRTGVGTGSDYGYSQYDSYRPAAFHDLAAPFPLVTRNKMDMLRAEAHLRAGNVPAAIALIDPYRIRAGLPALSGVVTAVGQPVPGGTADNPVAGGASCVPRIPVGSAPTWTGTKCGDVWEALKWEYRMENMFVGHGAWYLPARRWGDLPEGTALHWPVPYAEMDARRRPFYSLGGVGGRDAAGRGTYGL
jgi:hypothetical protein